MESYCLWKPTMKHFFAIIVICSLTSLASAAAKPLKVFILAGQSNMEGHAKVETFDYIGDDPATAPLLKKMRDPDGKPHVCDHVWISYFTGSRRRQRRRLWQADRRIWFALQSAGGRRQHRARSSLSA